MTDTISVLVVEPHEPPRVAQIHDTLEALQEAVGGYIEAIYPFPDPVAIICDEEAKLVGKELNRALCYPNGDPYDIIAGTFLITGLTEDNFGSLTEELIEKYYNRFELPQTFVLHEGIIHII